jgi:hypothetical protein
MGVAVGPVVVNRVSPQRFARAAERDLIADPVGLLREAAARAGVALAERSLATIADVAQAEARRNKNQRSSTSRLAKALDRPLLTLPALYEPSLGLEQLRTLAASLAEQGAIS